jgi:hypothetical protein
MDAIIGSFSYFMFTNHPIYSACHTVSRRTTY